MGAHPQSHHHKTKVTFECSLEEKTYIKMLAAKAHMTLGEFVLSYLRADFPSKKKKPNKKTLDAINELESGGGTHYASLEDFWDRYGSKTKYLKSRHQLNLKRI